MKKIIYLNVLLLITFSVFGQGPNPPQLVDCNLSNNPRECINEAIASTKIYLNTPRASKKIGWYNLSNYYLQLSRFDLSISDFNKVFEDLKLSQLYVDSLESLGERAEEDVAALNSLSRWYYQEMCIKLYSIDTLAFYKCEYCKPFSADQPVVNSSEIVENENLEKVIIPIDSAKIKEDWEKREELIRKQNAEIEARNQERLLAIQKENERVQLLRYNTFLYDTLGQLRIDSTRSIGQLELRQLKDSRELISASIVSALYDYEVYLYNEVLPKINYQTSQLLPYQIKDTTRHLYKITCDSSRILSIEHTLLSSNLEYGSVADSLIQMALPAIFPYLKINDAEIHEYFIPIIYIPFRYLQPECGFYFCNCQFDNGLVSPIFLNCNYNGAKYGMEFSSFNNGIFYPQASCSLDEFYFTIADGKPLQPCPEVAIERVPEDIIPIMSKRERRKYLKNKE